MLNHTSRHNYVASAVRAFKGTHPTSRIDYVTIKCVTNFKGDQIPSQEGNSQFAHVSANDQA